MRGSIRRRGRTWTAIWDEPSPDGKRRQRTKGGFATKRAAQQHLTDALSRIDGGTYAAPSRLTVGEYLTGRWLPAMRTQVRPSTLDSYDRNVRRHLAPRIGHVPLQRLTGDQLDALYAQLARDGRCDGHGLSAQTVLYLHRTLAKALGDAVTWGLVTRNAAAAAKPPRRGHNRAAMRTWTAPQLHAFLQSRENERLYALWHLLAHTGMRRGEVLGLAWEHVDLEAGRVAIRRTLLSVAYRLEWGEPKTDKSRRSVALDQTTVEALRTHRRAQLQERMALGSAWQDHGLVFCREDGRPIHPDRASKLFEQHVAASGLPRIRLHDLRHTHATLALQAGVHAKVVQERLGHSTIAMTLDTYSHAIPAMQEDAAAKVAALVMGGP